MSDDLRERLAALADKWDSVLRECKEVDPRWILDKGVMALDNAHRELRDALDETAEPQPECCIRYEFQNALARPVCEAHGELTGGYFKLELAAKIGDEHLTAQASAEAAQDGPTIEDVADLLTQQTVRVQVPNVGTMTGFLRRESAESLADVLRQAGVAR